jgi:regulatory protein
MVGEAQELALKALARKERSVAELGEWLRGRGVAEDEAEVVVDHLVSIGTLDDARFALCFAEDKRQLSGWGSERIRAALLERGIAAEDIEAALTGDQGEELERAERLLDERGADLADDGGRGRALALLVRRGYPLELAHEAIARRSRRE